MSAGTPVTSCSLGTSNSVCMIVAMRFLPRIGSVAGAAARVVAVLERLLEGGGRALDDRARDAVGGEAHARFVGGERAALDLDADIAAKDPLAVLEVEPRRVRLMRAHLHVALRDGHFAKQELVVPVVEVGGSRIDVDRQVGTPRAGCIGAGRREDGTEQGGECDAA